MLHPYCQLCGWRKGGVDSWDGVYCKCGHSEPAITFLSEEERRMVRARLRQGNEEVAAFTKARGYKRHPKLQDK